MYCSVTEYQNRGFWYPYRGAGMMLSYEKFAYMPPASIACIPLPAIVPPVSCIPGPDGYGCTPPTGILSAADDQKRNYARGESMRG